MLHLAKLNRVKRKTDSHPWVELSAPFVPNGAPNVVPGTAKAEFYITSPDPESLRKALEIIEKEIGGLTQTLEFAASLNRLDENETRYTSGREALLDIRRLRFPRLVFRAVEYIAKIMNKETHQILVNIGDLGVDQEGNFRLDIDTRSFNPETLNQFLSQLILVLHGSYWNDEILGWEIPYEIEIKLPRNRRFRPHPGFFLNVQVPDDGKTVEELTTLLDGGPKQAEYICSCNRELSPPYVRLELLPGAAPPLQVNSSLIALQQQAARQVGLENPPLVKISAGEDGQKANFHILEKGGKGAGLFLVGQEGTTHTPEERVPPENWVLAGQAIIELLRNLPET